MGNTWKGEISRTFLNICRPYNAIDVLKLPFLEELYEKNFVVPYVYANIFPSPKLNLRFEHLVCSIIIDD